MEHIKSNKIVFINKNEQSEDSMSSNKLKSSFQDFIVSERNKRKKILRNVIFDLNKLNYQAQMTKKESQEKLKGFQEYCSRFKKYIEFKNENPYCEKNLEFEIQPTPRMMCRSFSSNNIGN